MAAWLAHTPGWLNTRAAGTLQTAQFDIGGNMPKFMGRPSNRLCVNAGIIGRLISTTAFERPDEGREIVRFVYRLTHGTATALNALRRSSCRNLP